MFVFWHFYPVAAIRIESALVCPSVLTKTSALSVSNSDWTSPHARECVLTMTSAVSVISATTTTLLPLLPLLQLYCHCCKACHSTATAAKPATLLPCSHPECISLCVIDKSSNNLVCSQWPPSTNLLHPGALRPYQSKMFDWYGFYHISQLFFSYQSTFFHISQTFFHISQRNLSYQSEFRWAYQSKFTVDISQSTFDCND